MVKRRIYKLIIIALVLFSLGSSKASALDDAFGPARKIKSKHFSIYYGPQIEAAALTRQLNISPSDKFLVGKSLEKESSSETELAQALDILFIRVCDIMDMQLYSFEGNLKICQDRNQLTRIYNALFNKELKDLDSFYVYSLNTIYISKDDFKPEKLGHEIGHAVISHYFVVQPSVKIQEILAGYVEYQLRR